MFTIASKRGRDMKVSTVIQELKKLNPDEEIVVTRMDDNTTGWKRHICLEYQGNEYKLILFWDEFNGYEIFWREPSKAPDWAINGLFLPVLSISCGYVRS